MRVNLGLEGADLCLMFFLLDPLILLNGRLQFPDHTVKGVDHGPDLALSRRLHVHGKVPFLHLPHAFHHGMKGCNDLSQEISGKQIEQQE